MALVQHFESARRLTATRPARYWPVIITMLAVVEIAKAPVTAGDISATVSDSAPSQPITTARATAQVAQMINEPLFPTTQFSVTPDDNRPHLWGDQWLDHHMNARTFEMATASDPLPESVADALGKLDVGNGELPSIEQYPLPETGNGYSGFPVAFDPAGSPPPTSGSSNPSKPPPNAGASVPEPASLGLVMFLCFGMSRSARRSATGI